MSRLMRYPGTGNFYGGGRRGQRFEQYPISPYGNASAFNLAALSPLMRSLDLNPGYYGSTIGGYPVLNAEEVGTYAVPRAGRCALFDGVNDYATLGAKTTSGSSTTLTFSVRVKFSGTGNYAFGGEYNNTTELRSWMAYHDTASPGYLRVVVSADGGITNFKSYYGNTVINDGAWHTVGFTFDNGVLLLFVDGVLQTTTKPVDGTVASLYNTTAHFALGAYNTSTTPTAFFTGSIVAPRVYSTVKTTAEMLAIHNQHLTPTVVDKVGLLGAWWLSEESGTTHYDWSGNGKHLTATNITQGTYHAIDTGVTYSAANWLGHTVSGSVIIPRNESSPTLDAAGNALGVVGPVKHPVATEVPCVTGDGSAVYAVSGSNIGITGSASRTVCFRAKANNTSNQAFVSWGTSSNTQRFAILINSGNWYVNGQFADFSSGVAADTNWHHHSIVYNGSTIYWYMDGVLIGSGSAALNTANSPVEILRRRDPNDYVSSAFISDVRIYSDAKTLSEVQAIRDGFNSRTNLVAHWPIQEGLGTANTNRTSYDTVGTNNLTWTNGTVSSIWANRCPYAQDWSINYGGGIAVNGSFVPGRIGSNLDAAGNAKTLAAGKHGNPYSRLVPNLWSAPELVNIGLTSSTKLAPSDAVQATSPADTKFRRSKTDGSDRYFAVQNALTGSTKSNAEAYVA